MCEEHWKELSSTLRVKIAQAQTKGNHKEIVKLLPDIQSEIHFIKQ
jgi:hypothetical protein